MAKHSSKRFQNQSPDLHKELVKTNENQCIISKNLNPIFFFFDTLSPRIAVIPVRT